MEFEANEKGVEPNLPDFTKEEWIEKAGDILKRIERSFSNSYEKNSENEDGPNLLTLADDLENIIFDSEFYELLATKHQTINK